MKQLITLCLLFSAFVSGHSQVIQKGTQILSGYAWVRLQSSENGNNESSQSQFSARPMYSYFFTERFALTGGINYQSFINESKVSNSEVTQRLHTVGPVIGLRYFYPIVPKLYCTTTLYAEYGIGSREYSNNNSTSNQDIRSLSFSASPGLMYFLTKRIALSLNVGNIGFRSEVEKESNVETTTNDIEISYSPGSIGLHWVFGTWAE